VRFKPLSHLSCKLPVIARREMLEGFICMTRPKTQAHSQAHRHLGLSLNGCPKNVAMQINHTYVPNIRLNMAHTSKDPRTLSRRSAAPETRDRVLDAAERMFAERGIDGVSIRDITRAAHANLAAINYHFGSKQELVAQIFRRRLAPLNRKRLALLDAAERRAHGKPIQLEAILDALIRPAVEESTACTCGSKTFMQLFGRCLSEPDAGVERLIHSHFEKVIQRFNAAILRALPRLEEQELFWRISFIGGGLHHALLICGKPSLMPMGMHRRLNTEELIHRLITFAAASLRARVSRERVRAALD
jgi:AcrR family transcriptional regulator